MSQTVNKLKSNNTTGTDCISSKLVKSQSYLLIQILTHIFNMCIQQNIYPNNLKTIKIILVIKPDMDITDPLSFCYINLSNIFAKIFDRILYAQMMTFFEENKIFPSSHIGGLPGMSTSDAIELIHDKLSKSNSQNVPSCFISIDQKSAFTMIQHSVLLKKLEHISFSFKSLSLMKDYLAERKQMTYFNGSYSKILNIGEYGCFQGLVTSSLLHIIYVLDQPMVAHMSCPHENNYETNDECEVNLSINNIDNNMTEIMASKFDNFEHEAELFLKSQQVYHEDNIFVFNPEMDCFHDKFQRKEK